MVLSERKLRNIIIESIKDVLNEEESYIDRMVRNRRSDFENSPLKVIVDNMGLKRGEYTIGGDMGYRCIRLDNPDMEIRLYNNGKIFVHYGYDGNAGAWGGYTRKCEVKNPDFFKNPAWEKIVMSNGAKTSPDVIMM